jgi:hypothetical protein
VGPNSEIWVPIEDRQTNLVPAPRDLPCGLPSARGPRSKKIRNVGNRAEKDARPSALEQAALSEHYCKRIEHRGPSAFAVLALIVGENFVGSCTGKSVGLAP